MLRPGLSSNRSQSTPSQILYLLAAEASAPLLMSSRATASRPSRTAMCSGLRPPSPTAEASAPLTIRRHAISRSPNSLARRSNRSLQAFSTRGSDPHLFCFCFESCIYNPLHVAWRAMAAAVPLPLVEQRRVSDPRMFTKIHLAQMR